MNRTLYLHIGTEKTGTTFLQAVLNKNQSALRSQGYHFLQSGGELNNRDIPAICLTEERYDDRLRELGVSTPDQLEVLKSKIKDSMDEELSNLPESVHSVIISSEHFHSRTVDPEEVQNVYTLLAPYFEKIIVICYLREQSATAQSLYSTVIKGGAVNSAAFEGMMSRCTIENTYYNYHTMLSNWARSFGKDNIIIRKFDKGEFHNGDLVDDFLAQLNANPDLAESFDRDIDVKNESLSHFGLIVGMALNKTLPKFAPDGTRDQLRQQAFDKLYENFKGKGKSIDPKEYKRLYEHFDESNRQLNRDFFGVDDNFFEYREPASGAGTELDDEMADGLAEVFAEMSRGILGVSEFEAFFLRDLAVELEETDLKKAKHLMYLASVIRPEGPFLKSMYEKYRKKAAGLKWEREKPQKTGLFGGFLKRKQ